jgi:hypothetical protein
VSLALTTDAAGDFAFGNLRPGSYRVTETQPVGYSQGTNTAPAGSVNGDAIDFTLVPGAAVQGNTFADRRPATISGLVYLDTHRDGARQAAFDPGLAGVTVTLTGTDIGGQPVTRTVTTAADGTYRFTDLPPGTYRLTETLPANLGNGRNQVGSLGGLVGTSDLSLINLGANDQAQGYVFANIIPLPAQRSKTNFLGTTNPAALAPGAPPHVVRLFAAPAPAPARRPASATVAAPPAVQLFQQSPTVRRFTFSALGGKI